MRRLIWANSFRRALKKTVKQKPDILPKAEKALRLLAEDSFHPELHTYRLKGRQERIVGLQYRLR